jgi:hypothetical protein
MSVIFISHSSTDGAIAAALKHRLQEQNHRSVFLDLDPEQGIVAGQSWERTLYRKLRACRAVVAVITEDYLRSHWCFAEIALARMERKPIFALKAMTVSSDAKLPSILTEDQYIDFRSNEAQGYDRLWRGFAEAGLTAELPRTWDPNDAPYPGLLAFQEKHAEVFFGRERETERVLDLLNSGARQDLLLVLGASGSGKSSLVRAGVVPRLRTDSERWIVVGPFRPGQEPLEELAAALAEAFHRDWKEVSDDLRQTNDLATLIREYRRGTQQREATVLVVVDQLEELLGHTKAHLGDRFLSLLGAGVKSEGTPLLVLAAMRSDFLGLFQQNPDLGRIDFDSLSLGPVPADGLRTMIEQPARLGQIELEARLIDRLINDTERPDALPLLAFTLRILWEKFRGDGLLTIQEYETFGGLQGAVASAAETHFQRASNKEAEGELRIAFLRMARVTEDGSYARAPVALNDLPAGIHEIIGRFVDNRLLTVRDDGKVEVAHEALFRAWNRLAGWLAENGDELLLQQQIRNAAVLWEEAEHVGDELWRGNRLERAKELISGGRFHLTEVERTFITESERVERAFHERRERVAAYNSCRNRALKEYVTPYLRQREQELDNEISELDRERKLHFDDRAENLKQERNVLRNLLGEAGKWHPHVPTHYKSLGAMEDYIDVWHFACCGKYVTGDQPSQFRDDGCVDPPTA